MMDPVFETYWYTLRKIILKDNETFLNKGSPFYYLRYALLVISLLRMYTCIRIMNQNGGPTNNFLITLTV